MFSFKFNVSPLRMEVTSYKKSTHLGHVSECVPPQSFRFDSHCYQFGWVNLAILKKNTSYKKSAYEDSKTLKLIGCHLSSWEKQT